MYKKYLITWLSQGFLVALPLLLLIVLLNFAIKLVVGFVNPISSIINEAAPLPYWALNLFAVLVILIAFIILGAFISDKKGKRTFTQIERFLFTPIPLYKSIQNVIKQFRGVGEKPFERVVLIDMYGSGAYMTGFVVESLENDCVSVYVPTAPNPTNGFVLHVNKSKLIEIDTTTDQAMATVIGMGAGSCKILNGAEHKFKS